MKRLLISTALAGLIAAPAALAQAQPSADISTLPSNYDTADLNRIILAELNDEDGQTNANLDQPRVYSSAQMTADTIVDVASGDERFSTLVMLVNTAGLAETLSADGPYTVFAPTDEAFSALPAAKVDYLTSDEGREDLKSILKAHVTTGKLMASDVPPSGLEVRSVNDTTLDITQESGTVMIEGARVTAANIEASNGIIHVIDTVITPKESGTSTMPIQSSQSMPKDM